MKSKRTKLQRKKRPPPASPPSLPPPSAWSDDDDAEEEMGEAERSRAYDADRLLVKGMEEEIRHLLSAFGDRWTTVAVEELLERGATPPLHSVTMDEKTKSYTTYTCVIVHPSGRLMHGIRLTATLLRAVYGVV